MTDDPANPPVSSADDQSNAPVAEPPFAEPPVAEPPFAEPPVGEPPVGEPPVGAPGNPGPASVESRESSTVEPAEPPARTARGLVYLVSNVPGAADLESLPVQPELPHAAPVGVLHDGDADDLEDGSDHRDWAWVEQWREEREPTPWGTGLVLTGFSALVVGVAIWVLCAGLADRPVIAVLVNVLVAAGLAPAMWLCRGLPVLRWIAAGALLGVIGGWIAAIVMLPLPLP
jgi:hypothetical protein